MRVVAFSIVKDDRDHVRIFGHHIISGVQIVVVSGNVFGLFDEFVECPLKNLVSSSFPKSVQSWDFSISQFQIGCITVWIDVMSAKTTVMVCLLAFLRELAMAQLTGCSRSVVAAVAPPLGSSSALHLIGCFGRSGPDLRCVGRRRSSSLLRRTFR